MAKISKRERKFAAKGGAKGMLEKGTITKKGKLRTRKKSDNAKHANNEIRRSMNQLKNSKMKLESEEKRFKDDFTSDSNLGDLDLDSFLKNVADDSGHGGSDDGSDDYDGSDDMDVDGGMEEIDDSDDDDDDSDDDIEDEDVEVSEQRMKEELKKLAESDPEFHKYLQDNESSLLDFEDSAFEQGDDNEDDDDDDDDQDTNANEMMEEDNDAENDTIPHTNKIIVDVKLLKSYEKGAFDSHGVKPLRRIIAAYVSACHMADSKHQDEDGSGRLVDDSGKRSFHIESSAVFDKLMVTCLAKCHEEFHYHLLGKGASVQAKAPFKDSDDDEEDKDESMEETIVIDVDKPINPRHLAKSIRWTQLKLSFQSFFKATLNLISEAKETKLLRFIIKSLSHDIPYLSAFPRLAKAVLKTLVSLWSTTSDSTEDYQSVRLHAFLRIRQLALTQPFPFIENCLKSTYLAYAKSAKFANAATVTSLLPTLTFMGNCVVELYSLDYASSYQHAFVYIRQLALHLRNAMQKKTPEAFRVVYCWQYMHCIKLWTAVLAATCGKVSDASGDDEVVLMRSLVYPLVEIIHGVARLVPTTRHLPLRLHCVRYLQQLAATSEMFIPTTSILLEVFELKEVAMSPKRVKTRGNDVRGVRLPLILKLPKVDALRTAEQLDACFGEVFLLLNREIDLYKYSAGFPEFTIRIYQRLRKFAKETKNGRFRAFAKGCIELCEKHSKVATLSRSKLEEAPKDIKRLEVLKPNNVPSMGERYEMAIAKEKRLETAEQPILSKAAKAKARKEKQAEEQKKAREAAVAKRKLDAQQSKKKKQKIEINESDLNNVEALEEDDEVEEGIDWSNSEDGSESEGSEDSE
mmetsp:Transcript_4939/g.6378  ORF Transcript_4939/g.6378 Transcript_4939/m.6378 type:complete len:859 (+) Transcript_4939:142-2718(+)